MELIPELIDHILVHLDNMYIAIALQRNDYVIKKIYNNNKIKHLMSNELLCVQWIYKHQYDIYFDVCIILDACQKGNLDIIKWLYNETRFDKDFDKGLLEVLYKNNNLNVLEWFLNNTNINLKCDLYTLKFICNKGLKNLLFFVYKNKLTNCCILKSIFDSYDHYHMDIFYWGIKGNIIEKDLPCKNKCRYKNIHERFIDITQN